VSTVRRCLDRNDILCLISILMLATIFLSPALRPGYTLLPLGLEAGIAPWNKQVDQQVKNLLISDPFYFDYPYRSLSAQSLRRGELLLWTPYVFGGHPIMGDVLAQPLYPPNFIGALLSPFARAWVFLIWGHLVVTGLLMYGYLRQARLRPISALFGAVAWMFNATIVVWLEEPAFLGTIAWLPGIFWLISREPRRWGLVAGAGVMYGMLVLGGQLQYALGTAWLLCLWGTFHALGESMRLRRISSGPLIAVMVVGVLGIGISMVQLIPAFEFIRLSHRVNTHITFEQGWWPFRHTITLWMPDFYGNAARSPWWGVSNMAEMSAYFGVWPFVLSLCVFWWSRRREGWFWGSMVCILLLVLWGTPVANFLTGWLPGISYVPLKRMLCFLPFAGSIAAAFAVDAAQDTLPERPRRIWATLGVLIFILAMVSLGITLSQREQIAKHGRYLWPQVVILIAILVVGLVAWRAARKRPTWAMMFLVLLSCVDLMAWGMPFNQAFSLDILYPQNPITDWLRRDAGLYRVLPLQSDRIVFGPNVLSVLGFQEPGGYSSQLVGRYRDLGKAIQDRVDVWWMAPNTHMLVHSDFDPLFSMLNVKYVLSSYQRPERITREAAFEGCVVAASLRPGELVTQEFQVANPGLNRLDLKFRPPVNPDRATLRFRLWRERVGGALVAEIPVESTHISPAGDLVFFFAPAPDSMGETFVWGIEMTEVENDADLALCRPDGGSGFSFSAYSTQLKFADTIQGVWIYENPNVLPRAYVCYHVEATTDEKALARVRNREFNPWRSVLLSTPLSSELQALAQSPLLPVLPANVVEYDNHRVVVDVQSSTPGVLVLTDTWYPGWRVTVDGRKAELLRANYALRGVYVDSGPHRVVFQFRPFSFGLGAGITAATLLVVLLIIGLDGYLCRRAVKKNES